ncbi:hypothetical protein ES708_22917 [subsurface metagenome]
MENLPSINPAVDSRKVDADLFSSLAHCHEVGCLGSHATIVARLAGACQARQWRLLRAIGGDLPSPGPFFALFLPGKARSEKRQKEIPKLAAWPAAPASHKRRARINIWAVFLGWSMV